MSSTSTLDGHGGRKLLRLPVPQAARGRYRSIKTALTWFLLGIYFIGPWLRWDRGPALPDQAILFDLGGRRLFLFGLEFWPQDLPIAAGALILGAFGLFGATALAGRVWCGFTCPQTVWTDLFFTVERFVERAFGKGTTLARVARVVVQILIAVLTAFGFAAYFNDAPALPLKIVTGTAPFGVYITLFILTLTTWLFAAYAKERVCLHMCPWPRFQAALLDKESLVVTYQRWRGEPRGRKRETLRPELTSLDALIHEVTRLDGGRGDCIDCQRCVNVCPTGIDIRDGLQMGCIGCGLCVDACDEVMTRIDRPRGLIRFDVEGTETAGRFQRARIAWVRPKTIAYAGLCAAALMSIVFGIANMRDVMVDIDPQRGQPYVQLGDGSIRNDFSLRLAHRMGTLVTARVTVEGMPGATLRFADADHAQAAIDLAIPADRRISDRLMVTAPPGAAAAGRSDLKIIVTNPADGKVLAQVDSYFWGPER